MKATRSLAPIMGVRGWRDPRGAQATWSRATLSARLRVLAVLNGHTPSAVEIQRAPRWLVPATNTFIYHFGSLGAAQLAAGLPMIPHGRRRPHCAKGHRLTKRNVYIWHPPSHPKGVRKCRRCHRANRAKQWARQIAKRLAAA